MSHLDAARATSRPIVDLGGAFIVAPEIATEEERLGVQPRLLYFRGRSAVIGDPPAEVVTSLFGIFPHWLVDLALDATSPDPSADAAVRAYTEACAAWGRRVFAELDEKVVSDVADLLLGVVDEADVSALPLVAGWRSAARPTDPRGRLAFAIMLARELRGGVHFAALRAGGLTVTEAIALDPGVADDRLQRTGWPPEEIDRITSHAQALPDGAERWAEAEERTNRVFADALEVLDEGEIERLCELLADAHAMVRAA